MLAIGPPAWPTPSRRRLSPDSSCPRWPVAQVCDGFRWAQVPFLRSVCGVVSRAMPVAVQVVVMRRPDGTLGLGEVLADTLDRGSARLRRMWQDAVAWARTANERHVVARSSAGRAGPVGPPQGPIDRRRCRRGTMPSSHHRSRRNTTLDSPLVQALARGSQNLHVTHRCLHSREQDSLA